MAMSSGQAKSLLSEIGIGFALEYIDRATDPLKKTEEQINRTKKSVGELGTESDKTARKMQEMAKTHERLAGSTEKLLAVGAGLTAAGMGIKNMLASSVDAAGILQTTLVGAQLRIQDTSSATYNSMKNIATYMSTHFNVSLQNSAKTIDALSGSFKNLQQIQAMVRPLSILTEGSGGQLDARAAESLITNYMRAFNPNENLQTMSVGRLKELSNSVLGRLFTTHQIGKVDFNQMDNFLAGVRPSISTLRSLGDKSAETDLLALGTLQLQQEPNNPVNAGAHTGMIAQVMASHQLDLRKFGVNYDPANGIGGFIQALRRSPMIAKYMAGELRNNPQMFTAIRNALGGEYLSQPISLLYNKGGLEQFQYNKDQLSKNPEKVVEEYRKTLMGTFEYQLGVFKNAMASFGGAYLGEALLTPLTKIFQVLNPIIGKFSELLNANPEMTRFVARIVGMTTAVTALGVAFKVVGLGLNLLNGWAGISTAKLLLLGGAFTGISLVVTGLGIAYTKNFNGMRDVFDRWFNGIRKPLEDFKILATAAFQIFSGNGQMSEALFNQGKSRGLKGLIEGIAFLNFNMRDFFKGVREGFTASFKPFLDSFLAGFGAGGAANGATGVLGKFKEFMQYISGHDFEKFGKGIGSVIGGLAGNIGGVIQAVLPAIKEFFHLIKDAFGFLQAHPMLSVLVGQRMGGPVGGLIQAMGLTKVLGGQDAGLGKALTLGTLAGDNGVGRAFKGLSAAEAFSKPDFFNKLIGLWELSGALKGGFGGASGAEGDASGAGGLGLGSLAVNAQNVYINAKGGPGGSHTVAGGGGNSLLHNIIHPVSETVKYAGYIGAAGMVANFLGGKLNLPGLTNIGGFLKSIGSAPTDLLKKAGGGILSVLRNPNLLRFGGAIGAAEAATAPAEAALSSTGIGIVPAIAAAVGTALVAGIAYLNRDNTIVQSVSKRLADFFGGIFNNVMQFFHPGENSDGSPSASPASNVISGAGNFLTRTGNAFRGFVRGGLNSLSNIVRPINTGDNFANWALMAISGQESGGNYGIMNRNGSGAMGRYQFMPGTADSNVPSWFKLQYGSTTTARGRAAFLANINHVQDAAGANYLHALQSHIAKMGGNPQDIRLLAQGWYGGAGSIGHASRGGGSYGGVTYPSVGSYADQVAARAGVYPGDTHITVKIDGKDVAHHVEKHQENREMKTSGRDKTSNGRRVPGGSM